MAPTSEQTWEAHRRRILAETERFIEWGLKHPEDVTWIPAKPVGSGGFPRAVAEWFYSTILTERKGKWLDTWRQKLRRGGELLRGR